MLEPNRPAALYTTEADAEETEETVNHLITGEPSKEQLPPFFALSRSNGPGIGNRGRSVDLPPSLSRESHHGVTCCHAPPLSSSRPFFFFKALLPGLDHPERERERSAGGPTTTAPGSTDFPSYPSLLPSRLDAGHLLTLTERKLLKWGQNALLDTSKAPVYKALFLTLVRHASLEEGLTMVDRHRIL